MNSPEVFYPSTEWQLIPDWVQIPPGAECLANETTQKKWWRWSAPVPRPETVIDKRTGLPQQIPPVPPAAEPKYNSQADSTKSAKKPQAKDEKGTPEVSYAQAEPKPQAQPHAGLPTFTFPPKNQRPCFVNYWTDFLAESRHCNAGVYYHRVETGKNADGQDIEVLANTWICSPLEVVAITRIEGCKENSYVIDYIAHGEKDRRRFLLPQSLVVGRTDDVAKILRDRGVSVFRAFKTIVCQYLDREHRRFGAHRPQDFLPCVKVTGWHEARTFVLPSEIIGNQNSVYFEGRGEVAKYSKCGTIAQWNEKIAAPCLANPYLVFALCCSLAGPLLKRLGIPGIGFHLLGDSTTGKTTSLIVGATVWGPPDFVLSWRSTINALETQCASRSDTVVILDESHLVEAKHLDAAIYVLVHGASKARMNRDSTAKEIAHWSVVVLSSGERTLETHLAAAGIDHKAGQSVRIVDLPAKGTHGIFDDLHGEKSAAVFADRLRDAALHYYGYAGPAFVERFIKELPAVSLGEKLAKIVATFAEPLSAQQQRVWRSFAVVALAGELASAWKILPWGTGTALQAATKLFRLWLVSQPQSAASREHAQICKAITDFVDTHLDSRFSNIDSMPGVDKWGNVIEPPIIRDRAGYWQDGPDGKRIILFTPVGLHAATKTFDRARVFQVLDETGALVKTGSTQKSVSTRIPSENRVVSLYYIDLTKLQF
jgi:putative DNA primase/helicase